MKRKADTEATFCKGMQNQWKTRNLFRAAFFTVLLLCSPAAFQVQAGEIWVSPDGSDRQPGTAAQPKATLQAALRQAREWRRLNDFAVRGGIVIRMQGGVYPLTEPVFLRPEDSGTADSPTRIVAASGARPVLSGGRTVTGWKKAQRVPGMQSKALGSIWVAEAPTEGGEVLEYRQLWVGDKKAVRAREANTSRLSRILGWDKRTGILSIPAETLRPFVPNPLKPAFSRPEALELVLHQMWAISNLRVAGFQASGDTLKVTFRQPEARIQAERPWPSPMTADSVRSPFYLVNALEFLDQPGEWFLDTESRKLYYWPRTGEDLRKVPVVVPTMETLVTFQGTLDAPVSHIRFEGITFSHTTWMRPSLKGHVPLQAGMFMLDAYKLRPPGTPENPNRGLDNQGFLGRPSAAVYLIGVHHTAFTGCRFVHLGGSGLDVAEASFSDRVEGCLFTDIGSNGIQCGRFNAPGMEAHLPYNPEDERELCRHLTISNNLITNVANEDWGTEGIAAGYVRNLTVEHNEVSEVAYMGITVGWGWQKANNCMRENVVRANYIHHFARHMYDVAGIYTLSVQPKSLVAENAVDSIYHPAYVHDPNHWFYLYTDEGSSFLTVRDNWCPSEKFLQNANGPGVTWENNGPAVADSIRFKAGLEPAFRSLLHDASITKPIPY